MTAYPAGDELREFGPFRLRVAERLLERDGVVVPLGGRALDLLVALTANPGEVVSNQALTDQIWPQMFVDYARLRFHITALRKALGDGVDGARYITNVPGRGYCFVSPMEPSPPQDPLQDAPQVGLDCQAHAIPLQLRHVVGRDVETAAIAALLARRRCVTIVGPGGIGKTTVAVFLGQTYAADFARICFVDLGSLNDPNLVAGALAAALGVTANSDNLVPSLLAFLRGKRMLLILDSCEHVIETVSGLAEAIFEQAGEVHILATSRQALWIEAEQVHQLAPLGCPPASDTLTAAEAMTFSAVQLFVERACAASDRFVLLDAEAPAVARTCRRLDGIALAIELAAGRVDAYGVVEVEALLNSRLSLLWQGLRTAPPRHQTLNATLDWSYDLLPNLEQTILRRLVVFAGTFALEAAQAVARDDQVDGDQVVEVIASLVDKSLVMSNAHAGKVRYRVLDTTCAYLRGKPAEPGEIVLAARHHAEFFRDFLGQIGSEAESGYSAYGEHLGNVRAALEWSFSNRGNLGIGTALAAAAAPLFLDMSLLTECRRWAERALDAYDAAEGDPRIEMELQASLGLSLMFTEGNSGAVLKVLNRALELAEQVGDLGSQLRLLGCLNQYHSRSGDFLGAVSVAERGVGVARQMADPWGLTVAEWSLGVCHHMAGNQSSAILLCRSALQHPTATMAPKYMRHGLDHRIRALCALARAQWLCGNADDAALTVRYAMDEAERIENPVSLSVALMCTAFVFLWIGDLSEAEPIIERLAAHTKRFSLTPWLAAAMGLRGELAVRRGEAARAIPILTECLQIMISQRHDVLTSVVAGHLAEALGMSGRLDEALAAIEDAIAYIQNCDTSYDMPEILRLKGTLLARTGAANLAAAEECFERSLTLARRQGALSLELRTAMAIAGLRIGEGRSTAAHDALAPVFARFTQGMDTVDLRGARKLLDACLIGNLPGGSSG